MTHGAGFGIALVVGLAGSAAQAALNCTLTNDACQIDCTHMNVQFEIDPNQFVAPQSPNDPPRRQVTTVTMDDIRFSAEAIMLAGGVVGFHEDAGEIGRRLMIVQPNGSARLTLQPANEIWTGRCTDD